MGDDACQIWTDRSFFSLERDFRHIEGEIKESLPPNYSYTYNKKVWWILNKSIHYWPKLSLSETKEWFGTSESIPWSLNDPSQCIGALYHGFSMKFSLKNLISENKTHICIFFSWSRERMVVFLPLCRFFILALLPIISSCQYRSLSLAHLFVLELSRIDV